MEIIAEKGDILQYPAELVVVGIYDKDNWGNEFIERINDLLGGRFKKMAKVHEFKGAVGQNMLFPAATEMPAEYVLAVGLGTFENVSEEAMREATGLALQTAKRLGLASIAMEMLGEDEGVLNFSASKTGEAITMAALLGDYAFTTYKKPKLKNPVKRLTIVAEDGRDAQNAVRGIERAQIIADGVTVARDLVNTPAQDMNPTRLAETALAIAGMSNRRVKVKILDREMCRKKQMNAYLAVAQGSHDEPKFIHLTYRPENKAKKKVVVVGKGVTFDSGGLSLKPADFMTTMKCDMAGSAAVLGLFATLTRLAPDVEVHGVIAATDNMPSGSAMRPGDVVKASNGKTIEILNTDAEGRLTLADALHYACKLEPDIVVDMATLTGAAVVALGEEIGALMSTDTELAVSILASANAAGEKMWQMPLEPRYRPLIESEVADLRNTAKSRYGGSLTAGLFLAEFVTPEVKWAHIDIAGPAFAERPLSSYVQTGGTGYGVRTVIHFLENL